MYLLAFVTLLTSLLGLYVNVLGLEAARVLSSQSTFAQAMETWQTAAVSMAASFLDTNGSAYTTVMQQSGCSLTNSVYYGTVIPQQYPVCPSPFNPQTGVATNISGFGPVTSGTIELPAPSLLYNVTDQLIECVHMPATCSTYVGQNCASCTPQFDVADYQFYSILYKNQATGQNYVITFLPPASIGPQNPAPGFLSMAGGYQIGITSSDLMRQIQNSGLPNYTYGTVVVNLLNNTETLITPGGSYPLPQAFGGSLLLPNNTIALVGSPDGF